MPEPKILVIDDSIVIRTRISEMFADKKAIIIEAKDGNEGLKLIDQEKPNCIVLDFLMPNTSGWEVYQEIQKKTSYHSIPLVIMSGRKEEVTDKIAEPFEFFSFLEKPFGFPELIDALKKAKAKTEKRNKSKAEPKKGIEATINNKIIQLEKKVALLTEQVAALEKQVEILKQKEPTP